MKNNNETNTIIVDETIDENDPLINGFVDIKEYTPIVNEKNKEPSEKKEESPVQAEQKEQPKEEVSEIITDTTNEDNNDAPPETMPPLSNPTEGMSYENDGVEGRDDKVEEATNDEVIEDKPEPVEEFQIDKIDADNLAEIVIDGIRDYLPIPFILLAKHMSGAKYSDVFYHVKVANNLPQKVLDLFIKKLIKFELEIAPDEGKLERLRPMISKMLEDGKHRFVNSTTPVVLMMIGILGNMAKKSIEVGREAGVENQEMFAYHGVRPESRQTAIGNTIITT